MKYIRTKYGIFERMFPNDEQRISFDHKTIEPAYYTTKNDWVAKRDVINQADTIEELFDGFVFIDTSANEIHVSKDMEQAKNDGMFILGCSLFKETLRGFIRTDKGLIYVAQLNDKGEWGLL